MISKENVQYMVATLNLLEIAAIHIRATQYQNQHQTIQNPIPPPPKKGKNRKKKKKKEQKNPKQKKPT